MTAVECSFPEHDKIRDGRHAEAGQAVRGTAAGLVIAAVDAAAVRAHCEMTGQPVTWDVVPEALRGLLPHPVCSTCRDVVTAAVVDIAVAAVRLDTGDAGVLRLRGAAMLLGAIPVAP